MRFGDGVGGEAAVGVDDGGLDPVCVASVGEELDVKIEGAIKSVQILPPIRIHKVAGVLHIVSHAAQDPLIDFHLAFVTVFPVVIEADFAIFAGGFVVDDDQLARRIHPQVINGAGDDQVGGMVVKGEAFEIRAPDIEIVVLERDGIHAMRLHQRVRLALGAIVIKFLLEQGINGRIERKTRHLGPIDAQSPIKIKTARTLDEILQTRPAELEGDLGVGVKQIARSAGEGHRVLRVVQKCLKFQMQLPVVKLYSSVRFLVSSSVQTSIKCV